MTKHEKRKFWRRVDHWLHFFGFKKRTRTMKEKMCEVAIDLGKKYKQEAKLATAQLRADHEEIQ